MGIIKAAMSAVKGSLADQWLEVLEADDMSDATVFTSGVKVRRDDKRNKNVKGTDNTVSNGSVIHVYPNQFMMLVDGGKIVDYTAEEGYYTVQNSALPSLFNGQFGEALEESFNRVKYGGVTPTLQKVYFINLQEIKGIKFGTRTPVNYFDTFYGTDLFLRAHGTYSIKIKDPIRFYTEVVPKNKSKVNITEINEQYINEFLEAFQAALNQMSADGERISFVTSKGPQLSKYMSKILDEDWNQMRGMEIQAVGIGSISYDEETKELIKMHGQGAMLRDATVREGYVQGSIARGMEAAGSNSSGSMAGFMGMGVGMQTGGSFMGAATQTNAEQMRQQPAASQPAAGGSSQASVPGWQCGCGHKNSGKFCVECGKPQPPSQGAWKCECGVDNTGKFCQECGKPRPQKLSYRCDKCGYQLDSQETLPKFCPECGDPVDENDIVS